MKFTHLVIITITIVASLVILSCQVSPKLEKVKLIPQPNELTYQRGSLHLPESISIFVSQAQDSFVQKTIDLLQAHVEKVVITSNPESAHFTIYIDAESFKDLKKEGYILEIGEKQVNINAATLAGGFYALQTLNQILSTTKITGHISLPCLTIKDYPRFVWRGSMLDLSRRFMSVAYIKKHIDRMAAYKLNRLHLHLTDDQGWRIEIKSWPKLTEIGGKGACGDGSSGYLSQMEYLELQQYARERQIMIIPEIDLPGHIYAALVSYPEILLCADTSNINPKHVLPPQLYTGDKVGWSKLCLTDPESYRFVSEVIAELSAMTLGDYIHIGGDEIEDERYTEFIAKADSIVRANGKIMIGWEEVAKGAIHPNSIVQQWHGRVLVDKSQPTIYSLCQHLYLDHANFPGQEKTNNWCKADGVDLKDVYSLQINTSQYTLGIEAPIWTEYINESTQADGMLWPRLLAVSERGWSHEKRSYVDFVERVKRQLELLEEMGVAFYAHPAVTKN